MQVNTSGLLRMMKRLEQAWNKHGTHSVSDLQVGTFLVAWQRLSVLAGGGEGHADVLWVVPHRQLHLRADVLRRTRAS